MTESQLLPFNFGGIAEPKYAGFDDSRILVWPIPYEGTVSYGSGTGDGPRAIINASRNMELYDEEIENSVYKLGIHTLPELGIADQPAAMMARPVREVPGLRQTSLRSITPLATTKTAGAHG